MGKIEYAKNLEEQMEDNRRLSCAVAFAAERHAGQFRKGSDTPYIVHPMEVMLLLHEMGADTDLLIAGILHDTVEDTETTKEEIFECFGADAAELVAAHSEDKSLCWHDRKTAAIEELKHADRRLAMLILADKLSNIRSMAKDYKCIGEKLFERFHAGPKLQAWFYGAIQDAMAWMGEDPVCGPYFWEMVRLYKDIFVRYYLHKEHIYQVNRDGFIYRLEKGNPEWKAVWEPLPEAAMNIPRDSAEALEDEWSADFWARHFSDMKDEQYWLYCEKEQAVSLTLREHTIGVVVSDEGEESEFRTGVETARYGYLLQAEDAKHFMVRLRIECGITQETDQLILGAFGGENAEQRFLDFARHCGIYPQRQKL